MCKCFSIFAIAATIGTVSLSPLAAQAHHRTGHSGGPPHRSHPTESVQEEHSSQAESDAISQAESDEDFQAASTALTLTAAQRAAIASILQDTNDETILSPAIRGDIQSQIDSLPPGIQRRLARGRALPPGIAKKVSLPSRVNEQIDLGENVQIIVLGRDVVVVDPVTDLIVDIIRDVLL